MFNHISRLVFAIFCSSMLASVALAYDCGNLAQYQHGASYATHQQVKNNNRAFKCTEGGWCTIGGPYAPGVGWAWVYAWSDVGACGAATSSRSSVASSRKSSTASSKKASSSSIKSSSKSSVTSSSKSSSSSSLAGNDCGSAWYRANLTHYESYPDPGSEECVVFNGCTWAGQFYGLPDKKPESWVQANNIVAVHMKDWQWLGLKTVNLRQGNKRITAKVYDACSDSDCDGCCTANLGGDGYLVDIEKYTMQRFGSGEGTVEFQMCQ
jgi:hypothetical protein